MTQGVERTGAVAARERDHLHCPEGCEHPQPFKAGQLILCGLCFHFRGLVTPMVDCRPEVCG